jgi:hypothetical protein
MRRDPVLPGFEEAEVELAAGRALEWRPLPVLVVGVAGQPPGKDVVVPCVAERSCSAKCGR